MENQMLSVRNVTKKVKGRHLLDSVSFGIEQGTICGLLGPNGAGKTTLIRLLTGLIQPTKGEIEVNGIRLTANRKQALRNVGAIVESPIFFPYMSGKENLRNLARLYPDLSKTEQKERVTEVLRIVGLENRADDKVRTYSLGMKQRLGIAQALLGKPSFLILDEPANGLDPMGIRELRELIMKLNQKYGITMLISSHLLDEIQKVCEQIIVIRDGKLLWNGKKEDLANQHESLEDAFIELVSQ
ncbi:ABC transporter ATP-binding protein [Pueribacillus theae]|uniref:ABC transporter ATP-binding protein n=1 Tax=Pueribacillus theae TaxID=2171751 RepID=A0A2U1JJV1_9BACI|nr:ABC transporter ATP-binding protein [Pueribacillus theae]PWA05158.1 ABC transporter ATP-binding protein [Pueribacillus theae]